MCGGVIGQAIQGVGRAIKTVADVAIGVIGGAIGLVVGLFTKNLFNPGSPDAGSQRDPGVESRIPANAANKIPVIYGTAWVKGQVIHGENTSDFRTAYYVISLSELTDSGNFTVTDIYWQEYRLVIDYNAVLTSTIFDNAKYHALISSYYLRNKKTNERCTIDGICPPGWRPIPLVSAAERQSAIDASTTVVNQKNPNYGAVSGAYDAGGNRVDDFNGKLKVIIFNGMPDDRSLFPATPWFRDTKNKMSKLLFAFVTVNYDVNKNIYQLEDMTFKVTNTLSAPGSVFIDYLKNIRYGCGIPEVFINTDSFDTLNNYSNELIQYKIGDKDYLIERYSINGLLNTNDNCFNNLQRLANSCGSLMSYNSDTNKISVFVDMPQDDIAFYFNESNIVGSETINLANYDAMPTNIEYKFKNTSTQYKDQYESGFVGVPIELSTAEVPVVQNSFTYDFINNEIQAKRLSILQLNTYQLNLTTNFSADHSALLLKSGDLIAISDYLNGWKNKKFRIGSYAETEQEDGRIKIEIIAKEYSDEIYKDLIIVKSDPAPNISSPSSRAFGNFTPLAPTATNLITSGANPSFDLNFQIPGTTTPGTVAFSTQQINIYLSDNYYGGFVLQKTIQSGDDDNIYDAGSTASTTLNNIQIGSYYFKTLYSNNIATSNLSTPSDRPFTWWFAQSGSQLRVSYNIGTFTPIPNPPPPQVSNPPYIPQNPLDPEGIAVTNINLLPTSGSFSVEWASDFINMPFTYDGPNVRNYVSIGVVSQNSIYWKYPVAVDQNSFRIIYNVFTLPFGSTKISPTGVEMSLGTTSLPNQSSFGLSFNNAWTTTIPTIIAGEVICKAFGMNDGINSFWFFPVQQNRPLNYWYIEYTTPIVCFSDATFITGLSTYPDGVSQNTGSTLPSQASFGGSWSSPFFSSLPVNLSPTLAYICFGDIRDSNTVWNYPRVAGTLSVLFNIYTFTTGQTSINPNGVIKTTSSNVNPQQNAFGIPWNTSWSATQPASLANSVIYKIYGWNDGINYFWFNPVLVP